MSAPDREHRPQPMRLHINIDHVATVRNARGTFYPDPVFAAELCEASGADGITAHLREDRRHIRDEDVLRLRKVVTGLFNLEMAATEEMIEIAERIRPDVITLVPERRQERTTEGGLDVRGQRAAIEAAVKMARNANIKISLFVAPHDAAIDASAEVGADQVELHTGDYCHTFEPPLDADARQRQLELLKEATARARVKGLEVAAGHGLTRHNVADVAAIPGIVEVNIGHSVIADAVLFGLDRAVRDLREVIERHRR